MSTVENWPRSARLLSTGWLLAWIVVGSYLLFTHRPLAGIGYLALWVVQYVHCRHLACTRCYYYGKRCHMLGGDCAKLLFEQREPGRRMPDDALVGLWWAVVTIFPVPFFIAWKSWPALAVFLCVAVGWHGLHHVLACKRCRNTSCPLNAAKKPGIPASSC